MTKPLPIGTIVRGRNARTMSELPMSLNQARIKAENEAEAERIRLEREAAQKEAEMVKLEREN